YNNPLPRWWLWTFYGTVVFSLIYWVLYPTWPVGESWTKGINTVEYTVDGETREARWNTRYRLIEDMQNSEAAQRQRAYLERIAEADFEQIRSDPEMLAFARSVGTNLFGDNCAACHGRGGQGVAGLYPNLADDDWLWGGTMAKIQETLVWGRKGYMPPFKETFDTEQWDAVAEYVMVLSGEAQPSDQSERGREIFQGQEGGCFHCHGMDGKGIQSQGAANLTDRIWTVANVPAEANYEAKKGAVKNVIWNGVQNIRNMPAWHERLTETDIKLLAVYVHQLGGGE
ncbi:MAG: cytochrome-c oxidase, cbb3-type subunit III, partial [Candidatus Competibacteraceae bacterium]|nr:cytochrome-c oxidase, cbb3-type subunit III [Candidatus Competibacteraceae bacterium]